MASYERNFPLKDLAPVFAEIEAARKETEEARAAAKKGKGKKHAAADEPPGEPGALTCRMPGHPWTLAPHMAMKQEEPLSKLTAERVPDIRCTPLEESQQSANGPVTIEVVPGRSIFL